MEQKVDHGFIGNLVYETIGCKASQFLIKNLWAKQLLIIIIVYLILTHLEPKTVNPLRIFIMTLLFYFVFIFIIKLNKNLIFIIGFLFIIAIVIHNYIRYYEKTDPASSKLPILNYTRNVLNIIMLVLVLGGFMVYFFRQYKTTHKTWGQIIFGPPDCSQTFY